MVDTYPTYPKQGWIHGRIQCIQKACFTYNSLQILHTLSGPRVGGSHTRIPPAKLTPSGGEAEQVLSLISLITLISTVRRTRTDAFPYEMASARARKHADRTAHTVQVRCDPTEGDTQWRH